MTAYPGNGPSLSLSACPSAGNNAGFSAGPSPSKGTSIGSNFGHSADHSAGTRTSPSPSTSTSDAAVAITRTRGVLVVTMQPDLDGERFDRLRVAAMERASRERVETVVLDFSAVDVLSLVEFERARHFLTAMRLLGHEVAMVSLAPSVVLYLTEVQADTSGVHYFRGLDEALRRFGQG